MQEIFSPARVCSSCQKGKGAWIKRTQERRKKTELHERRHTYLVNLVRPACVELVGVPESILQGDTNLVILLPRIPLRPHVLYQLGRNPGLIEPQAPGLLRRGRDGPLLHSSTSHRHRQCQLVIRPPSKCLGHG